MYKFTTSYLLRTSINKKLNLNCLFHHKIMLANQCGVIFFIVCSLVSPLAVAGNGIDSSTIPYKKWPNLRPASVSVISGRVVKNLRLFGGTLPQGVAWETSKDESQEKFRQQICSLAKEPCKPFYRQGVGIGELYIGEPAKAPLPQLGDPQQIGLDSLAEVGAGAKRILLLSVEDMGQTLQTATIVFDAAVTDDELRQLALEDAVYRVLRYRED